MDLRNGKKVLYMSPRATGEKFNQDQEVEQVCESHSLVVSSVERHQPIMHIDQKLKEAKMIYRRAKKKFREFMKSKRRPADPILIPKILVVTPMRRDLWNRNRNKSQRFDEHMKNSLKLRLKNMKFYVKKIEEMKRKNDEMNKNY